MLKSKCDWYTKINIGLFLKFTACSNNAFQVFWFIRKQTNALKYNEISKCRPKSLAHLRHFISGLVFTASSETCILFIRTTVITDLVTRKLNFSEAIKPLLYRATEVIYCNKQWLLNQTTLDCSLEILRFNSKPLIWHLKLVVFCFVFRRVRISRHPVNHVRDLEIMGV